MNPLISSTAVNVVRATLTAQQQSDKDYTDRINACIDRWTSFLDISTRSVGIFT